MPTPDQGGSTGSPAVPGGGQVSGPTPGALAPPELTHVDVSGRRVELGWAWRDERTWDAVSFRVSARPWDAEAGRFGDARVVSEDWLEEAVAYRPDRIVRGSCAWTAPSQGLHAVRVEVLARNRPVLDPGGEAGRDTVWRAWRREKVLVGGQGWSVVPLPAAGGRPAYDPADPRFRLRFELYLGSTLCRDCALTYLVGWPGILHGHECDPGTGERALHLSNPRPGAPGAWRLTFAWSDDAPPFAELRVRSTDE